MNARQRVLRRFRGSSTALERSSLSLLYLYVVWAFVIFDPHRYLAAIGPGVFHRTMTVMFYLLILLIVIQAPAIADWIRGWMLYWPFLIYLLVSAVTVPFAYNIGNARGTVQSLLLFYLLAFATLVFVRNPRQTLPILLLFPLQYVWWAWHAKMTGLVRWHPAYANTDGFGPLVVMGMGICFYFALAAESKRLKWLGFFLAAYCVLGVVASFARGAVLSAGAVVLYIWLRSQRKVLTGAAVVVSIAVLLASIQVLYPNGEFWLEMKTAFTEGTELGTGGDRWELWRAAYEVFRQRPVFGVGAANFGPFAAAHFGYGEISGYANPGMLYDRNLHSVYLQVFSEFGAVGSLAFLLLLFDFWRRNRALRRPQSLQVWSQHVGDKFDLTNLSLALELGMVAFLVTGFFYAQLYNHWLYTLLAANLMLYGVVCSEPHRSNLTCAGSLRRRRPAPGDHTNRYRRQRSRARLG